MVPILAGTSAYLLAGILSMIQSRYRFWFSLFGWAGAVAGLVRGILLFDTNGVLITNLGEWGVLGLELKIDQTTLLFAALVVVLNIFTLLYLAGRKHATFYVLYNFLFATSFSLAFSNDLFNIYVSIELLSLIAILLIGYERKPYQIYAGIKYLVISSLAMSLYLIGLGLLYKIGGHLGIDQLAEALAGTSQFGLYVAVGLMVTGLAVKAGVFLFSMWLPDAYSYSGIIVSVLLAGIGTKAGLIGLIRLSVLPQIDELLLGLGVLTGVIGGMFAILGRKPKRILAFSSISQVGYVLIGVGIGTSLAIRAASLHIFFHGLFKGLLFLSVGHAEVGGKDIYKDTFSSVPLGSKIGLAVGSLSIMAIPPFSGYFSKALLLEESGQGWVGWSILAIGFFTVVYFLELDRKLLFGSLTKEFNLRELPLIGLALAVGLSGLIGFVVLGIPATIHLMALRHLAITSSLLPLGAFVGFLLINRAEKVRTPNFLFNLDNALISIFTGFLFIVSTLVFV